MPYNDCDYNFLGNLSNWVNFFQLTRLQGLNLLPDIDQFSPATGENTPMVVNSMGLFSWRFLTDHRGIGLKQICRHLRG